MPQRMTIKEAQQVFASLMATARTRPLTDHEKSELSYARQQLRADRKGARRNPREKFFITSKDSTGSRVYFSVHSRWTRSRELAKQFSERSARQVAAGLRAAFGGRGPVTEVTPVHDDMENEGLGHFVMRENARRGGRTRGERDRAALAELARRTTVGLAPDANFQVKFAGYYAHFAREADARNYYRLAHAQHPRSTYLFQKIGGRWKKIPATNPRRRAVPAPRPFGPGDTVAYRGYLIGQTMTGDTAISADGVHISWARDLTVAKKIVDSLIDPQVRWNPSHLEQLTDARMREISEHVGGGWTQYTGKAIVDESGKVIGRHGGGFFKQFPELAGTRRRPGEIAAAIDKGSGRVYDEIRGWVRQGMADYAPAPRRRSPERPTVPGHKATSRRCTKCGVAHGKGSHRFHGRGAFHRTHAWGFPQLPPLGNPADDPRLRAQMLLESITDDDLARRIASLDPDPEVAVAKAQSMGLLARRPERHPHEPHPPTTGRERGFFRDGWNDGITAARTGKAPRTFHTFLTADEERIYHAGFQRGIASARPKENPRQVRMGRLVELRYERDHGASPGFYKHEFKVRPTIYYRPSDNSVWIRGGR